MRDVDRALDEVGRFAARPPVAPRGVEEIVQQAAARRRRKRLGGMGLGAAGLVAVALIGGALLGDDGREVQVTTRPDSTSTTGPAPATTTSTAVPVDGLSVVPDSGLEPGQVVTVTDPSGLETIGVWAICASEANDADDPYGWCDQNVLTEKRGDGPFELTVVRVIQTGYGLVDCAEAPARCLVGVRTVDGRDLSAPISFRPDLPPLADPTITVTASVATDGERIEISGRGYDPEAEVWLAQCQGEAPDDWDDWRHLELCDVARPTSVTADAAGRWTAPYLAYAEIQTYEEWVPCDPCVLVATTFRQPAAAVALQVRADGPPIRPQVRMVPGGPYDQGQRVRLEGVGFQAGLSGSGGVSIGWCAFRTDSPETEIQGDPNFGYTSCAYPSETAFGVPTDELGRLVVERFPLPDGSFGFQSAGDCAAPDLRCGLAWHPGEGTLPVFVTLFELR